MRSRFPRSARRSQAPPGRPSPTQVRRSTPRVSLTAAMSLAAAHGRVDVPARGPRRLARRAARAHRGRARGRARSSSCATATATSGSSCCRDGARIASGARRQRRGAAVGHRGLAPARRARAPRRRVDGRRRRPVAQRHVRQRPAHLRPPRACATATSCASAARTSPTAARRPRTRARRGRRAAGRARRPDRRPSARCSSRSPALQGHRVRDAGDQPGDRRRAVPLRRRRQGAPALAVRLLRHRAPAAEPEALVPRRRGAAGRRGLARDL